VDWLILLRGLTLAARLGLAVLLVYLVVGPARSLGTEARRTWLLVAVMHVVLAADNAVVEGLRVVVADLPADAALRGVSQRVYDVAYLVNAMMSAALPLALLAVLLRARALRYALGGALVLTFGVAVAGVLAGALESWARLLGYARVLSMLAASGYLTFWAFLLLGALPRVDAYLAGFLAVRTLFVLLLPVQEAFFQIVGRAGSAEMWELLQVLQLAMAVTQVVIVLALIHVLARGRGVRSLGAPISI